MSTVEKQADNKIAHFMGTSHVDFVPIYITLD